MISTNFPKHIASLLPWATAVGTLIILLVIRADAVGVEVDLAAGSVQANAGCASETAAFCDLRIYQVMVEAFVDGDSDHDYGAGYGTSHHRGDLRGIIDSLDYIESLGMNAIWMTPIFNSYAGEPQQKLVGSGRDLRLDATGYYTRDYFEIDPRFGTMDDARELVEKAHERGIYVLLDGVFGHHKGGLIPSPTGKLPVDSTDPADYFNNPAGYPGRVVDYDEPATLEFYKEVATYWIEELGIDGWRLDQSFQVPAPAWREIKSAVEQASAARAQQGEAWGTLGYLVAELWADAGTISNTAFGSDANPILDSAFDFPVRYATVQVLAGEESGRTGLPATELNDFWSYGAHGDNPEHALPNLMIGNHDLVRYGDLLQRAGIANPGDPEYWTRHRLAFLVQAAYSGPITRYYGEEIGDELPGYAARVTNNCASLGLCDDHVARTSAKILGVTVAEGDLSADQLALIEFHQQLMAIRDDYRALSHGTRQHLYSDNNLYIDLKSFGDQQIVFAMNVGDEPMDVDLSELLFGSTRFGARDLLGGEHFDFANGLLSFRLEPLSGRYLLLNVPEPTTIMLATFGLMSLGLLAPWWRGGREEDGGRG